MEPPFTSPCRRCDDVAPPVVFLVDDDSSVRNRLRRLITSVGFIVEVFLSGLVGPTATWTRQAHSRIRDEQSSRLKTSASHTRRGAHSAGGATNQLLGEICVNEKSQRLPGPLAPRRQWLRGLDLNQRPLGYEAVPRSKVLFDLAGLPRDYETPHEACPSHRGNQSFVPRTSA
jgi:hypothetical protein